MKTILTTLILILSTTLIAQVIWVPTDQSTIQEGIDAASDGDTILVSNGTYYENINFLGKAITVASQYLMEMDSSHIYNTIIDGSQPSPGDSACVVLFNSGEDTTSVLYGFTITGGTGCYWPYLPLFTKLKAGGGVQIINCGAKICHNIITDNHVENEWEAFGGGVHGADIPEDRMIIVEDNLVYNNTVTGKIWVKGGGICVAFCHTRIRNNVVRNNESIGESITMYNAAGGIWYSSSVPYVTHVDISGNTITNNEVISSNSVSSKNYGGGMVIMAEDMIGSVYQNTIANNTITASGLSNGGGLLIDQCDSLEVFDNVIHGNQSNALSSYGGGIGVWESQPLLSHNLIYDNRADKGGGIWVGGNDQSHAQIINNTIYGNDADKGGGIYLNNSICNIKNTIAWGNTAISDPGIYQEISFDNTINYSDVQGGWSGIGFYNIDSDPLFLDPLSGDFHLTQNSPCINAGDPNSPPDPDGSICDMGAFYYGIWPGIQHTKADNHTIKCFPNPFSRSITIEYELEKPGNVQITLSNHLGQQIKNVVRSNNQSGLHQYKWDATNLPDGIYFVHIRSGGEISTRKIIKMR